MMHYDKTTTSIQMQQLLDSYFIELYEKGEKRTANQIGLELNIHGKTVYTYINYCNDLEKKKVIFNYMMHTLIFRTGSNYYNYQQKYLEREKKIERKKKAMIVIKELLERQKAREEKNNIEEKFEKVNKL